MIKYKVGSLFDHLYAGTILVHIVNNLGLFGKGFAYHLNKAYPENTKTYKKWAAEHGYNIPQGAVLFYFSDDEVMIANCCAQSGIIGKNNPVPFKAESLELCLAKVAELRPQRIVMPRIGCNLGGSTWNIVEPIIEKHLGQFDVEVFTLPNEVHLFAD